MKQRVKTISIPEIRDSLMDIHPVEKGFNLLPVIKITKHINPLSEQAKKSFDSNWNRYYSLEIAWLFFSTRVVI